LHSTHADSPSCNSQRDLRLRHWSHGLRGRRADADVVLFTGGADAAAVKVPDSDGEVLMESEESIFSTAPSSGPSVLIGADRSHCLGSLESSLNTMFQLEHCEWRNEESDMCGIIK